MCQSQTEGGRRCAAHTRPAYVHALTEMPLTLPEADLSARVDAGLDAVIDHATTPSGATEVAQMVNGLERRYQIMPPRTSEQATLRERTLAALRSAQRQAETRTAADTAFKTARTRPVPVDRADSRTWSYDYPEASDYADLDSLVDGYEGYDAHWLPWLRDAQFRLLHNYDLSTVAGATSAADFTASMDWDEDEADEAEEHTAGYEVLADVLHDTPWEVPPLIVVEHADGSPDLIDGNHRAGLALHAGSTTHPAYVVVEPPGADCGDCRSHQRVRAMLDASRASSAG